MNESTSPDPEDLKRLDSIDRVLDALGYEAGDSTRLSLAAARAALAALQAEPAKGMVAEISAEVERATRKFPTWPTDPLHAVAVLGEEFGELTKAMLQLTYEPHKTSAEEVRTEAIQTAAMALRLAMSLGRYEYAACPQHSQSAVKSGLQIEGEE